MNKKKMILLKKEDSEGTGRWSSNTSKTSLSKIRKENLIIKLVETAKKQNKKQINDRMPNNYGVIYGNGKNITEILNGWKKNGYE